MKDIYFLAEALRTKSVGEVATVIETQGCYCEDKFGRFMPVDEAQRENVLAVLAEFYRQEQEWLDHPFDSEEAERYPHMARDPVIRCDGFDSSDPVWHYGWPEEKRPTFSEGSGSIANIDSLRPLRTTERNTLLIIIAALCDHSEIKIDDRGAASQIARLTDEIGASVSDDTVRRWLKSIPDALESRMK